MKALVDYCKVAVWVSSNVQLGLLPAEPCGVVHGRELCVREKRWLSSAGKVLFRANGQTSRCQVDDLIACTRKL